MSDDKKDFGNEAEDAFDDANESGKEFSEGTKKAGGDFADEGKKTANEFSEDTKKAGGDFADEAKKTANEFSEGLKGAGGDNKKIMAGILAIVLGAFGVHKFILGYQKEGIILLAISLVGIVLSCVGIGVFIVWITGLVGLVEGIIYLTKSDEEFYNTYQVGKKPWF
jgi:TM2 domain-containing membrane protein YozV